LGTYVLHEQEFPCKSAQRKSVSCGGMTTFVGAEAGVEVAEITKLQAS
jgi:hypothetical protein